MILYYMFSVLPKSKCCMHPLYFKVVHSVIMKLRLSLAMKKKENVILNGVEKLFSWES